MKKEVFWFRGQVTVFMVKGQSSGIPGLTDIRKSGDSPLIRYGYHGKRWTRAFRQGWME